MDLAGYFDSVARDVRHALRTLPRRPSFTVAAVVTLALGLGATAAIFSVVYSVLLKPLPYPNPDELVRIRHTATVSGDNDLTSAASMYFTYRAENRTLAEIGMWSDGGETLTRADGTERVRSLRATYGLLQALGVPPVQGRWFTEAEHGPSRDVDPVIVSYAFAESRFGSDAAALGTRLVINGRQAEVVGVMPRDFRFLDMTPTFDIIVATQLDPARQSIGIFNLHALARLRPGVTPDEARADLARMVPIWLDSWPMLEGFSGTRESIENMRIAPVVRPLKDDIVGDTANALWVLMAAIGAVLLVACANIANLMLVRADARRQELALRAALGAVPARIARELLVESLVIGAIGGALGLALAYGGIELLLRAGPANLPRLTEVGVHPPVIAFTVLVSLATTLAFGGITALKHAWGSDAAAFGSGGGFGTRASTSRAHGATRSVLVVVQVALALVLVVSAVLMARTFEALRDVRPGFLEAASIQTVRTWAPNAVGRNPAQIASVQRDMLEAIEALPGVESAGFTSVLPMEGGPFNLNFGVVFEDAELAPGDSPPTRRMKFVTPGYFETMGTRIVAGRDLTWADLDSGGRVALISEELASELGGTPADALGRRIRTPIDTDDWREVIGVVESVKEDALHASAPGITYWPTLMQNALGNEALAIPAIAFVIRSDRTGTASFNNEIREAIWSVSRDAPVALERTMQSLYAASLARTSFALVMLAIAGAMALVLGLVGIYGVIAYIVAQRSREIGIRLALGAQRHAVRRMFLRQGLALSVVGVAIGLVVALGVTRLMASLLFGVSAADVVTYAAAVGVILAAAALASYLPARRASSIDPIETLKAE